ncbi:hypothetical protein PLICRDRAFT_117716 [Plicaturopsis crispa FD-325 SS-3]|uniref:Ubiquitin-like protease family profile domain-containing protein n=1 Tax=Plicaturopsis crispa FD-325 SS-3 TaxID=944288 RepID=A0A0C9T551_PLICR|nr:hypothetical protein PLICRDRAFT_117716 [Plicaturopsis crispa FD-325 SS-3]
MDVDGEWVDDDASNTEPDQASAPPDISIVDDVNTTAPKRRILPDAEATRLYAHWKSLTPSLVESLLEYTNQTMSKVVIPAGEHIYAVCSRGCMGVKSTDILCLYFDLLVRHGLFPTSPSQPRMAVSIELLDFYHALFERSCDAVNAMASALHSFYTRRGFHAINKKGERISDPFRRSLGSAIQWHDILHLRVQERLDAVIRDCDAEISRDPESSPISQSRTAPSSAPASARILQQRCPACFGGVSFGRSFDDGGDIHVATDGNFHHRHRRAAGDSRHFYDPQYVLPKEQVDLVGQRIDNARKKAPKAYSREVPDEAVDDCQESHDAANGSKQKANMDAFDDSGWMALVCRHNIPLFFANIDTPGEQQKYAVALLEHLYSLLPPEATVVCLYDVGCVLDRSLSLYDILPDSITSRLVFVTSAMHAYGHQWSCQLIYNPRLRKGLGLTDGEGVERLWSRLRKLIGITRSSGRSRRIWLLDRQASSIGLELRDDLGDWIHRRLGRGITAQGAKAQKVLDACGVSIPDLREQWANQKASQLSLRAHAPQRLKKELDTVLVLQGDLDTSEKAIQNTKGVIAKGPASQDTQDVISGLERTHDRLKSKVESLYASLNIHTSFPELEHVDLEFVRILLMARDLKINIRKRAIGSFFEWDKLDQAVGGAQQPLGTKLHQHTRKAIAKRQPALMTAIRKFNMYCERLEELHQAEWSIPLPQPLPTKLADLRDGSNLMEDVWISPSEGLTPRWLEDADVRDGIRAMLKLDRCLEERRRLGFEADNLCRWFGRELAAVELALRRASNSSLSVLLGQRREQMLLLKNRWINPFVSAVRFQYHVTNSVAIADRLCSTSHHTPPQLHWITPVQLTMPDTSQGLPLADVFSDNTELVPLESDQTILDYFLADASDDEDSISDDDDETALHLAIDTFRNVSLPLPIRPTPRDLQFSRVFTRDNNSRGACFETNDLQILASATARLNDNCMNGSARLLQSLSSAPNVSRCAIFSTFELVRIRDKASDDILWRNTRRLSYWLKDIWIVPIHRTTPVGHWVLCTVYPRQRELFLFDSLCGQRAWSSDIESIMELIRRIVSLANDRGYPLSADAADWTAHPVLDTACQTNGYDCGLWVLASMVSIFRGYHVTGLREADMAWFRAYLLSSIIALPTAS